MSVPLEDYKNVLTMNLSLFTLGGKNATTAPPLKLQVPIALWAGLSISKKLARIFKTDDWVL